MFLISDAKLTSAVCRSGATAAFPALNFRSLEDLRKEIKAVKESTSAPFGINIIVQETNKLRDSQIEVCLEEGVSYFISSLGNPSPLIRRAHASGAKVFCDVVSEKHAAKALDAGADGLVAVSAGAGGHAGTLSPFALVPQLKKKYKVPVIAAGSIVDGRTMLAALALGADAVYVGTRFIACTEASAPTSYKNAIIDADPEDIVYTDRVDGFPGNFIHTDSFEKYIPNPNLIEKLFRMSPKFDRAWRLYKAGKALFGDPNQLKASYKTVFSAGQGVGTIERVENAEDIVFSMIAGYFQVKESLPGSVNH